MLSAKYPAHRSARFPWVSSTSYTFPARYWSKFRFAFTHIIRLQPRCGPTCADWVTAATHDANDLDAMRKALCCWADTIPARRRWLAQVATVDLAADCIERSMPILVSVPKCC